jgi:effector-binding domain-containing protein
MSSKLIRLTAAAVLAAVAAMALPGATRAQQAAPPAPTAPEAPAQAPSPQSPTAPTAPGGPAPAAPSANAPAAAPEASKPAEQIKPQGEASSAEAVELSSRPFVFIESKANRDEIYSAILGSLGLVKRDMDKAGLKPAARPLAVFVDSDESGFKYRAGFPLEAAPEGKTSISDAVKIGQTPGGKAMRFQHLGSYADIDGTYDAITAYLDEKGVDAQDSFVEEYVNDVKDADDPTLQVNIYVLLK